MILFTGEIYQMFSNQYLIDYSRQIDFVSIHGQPKDFEIYTFDLNIQNCKLLPLKNPLFRTTSILEPIKEQIESVLQQNFL